MTSPQRSRTLGAAELDCLRSGLRLLALRRLGDLEAAEEAAQETLARTVAAIHDGRLADPAKLGAFAHGIARHVIVDTLRARRRARNVDDIGGAVAPTSGDDPLEAAVSAEERERVQAALRLLSPADRHLLHLSFFDGLDPAEIAARMGESSERIRKRKSRALDRLRGAFFASDGAGHKGAGPATEQEGGADSAGAPGGTRCP